MSKIQDEKRQIGEYWQYRENQKELTELLKKVKFLRKQIAKYENKNSTKK